MCEMMMVILLGIRRYGAMIPLRALVSSLEDSSVKLSNPVS